MPSEGRKGRRLMALEGMALQGAKSLQSPLLSNGEGLQPSPQRRSPAAGPKRSHSGRDLEQAKECSHLHIVCSPRNSLCWTVPQVVQNVSNVPMGPRPELFDFNSFSSFILWRLIAGLATQPFLSRWEKTSLFLLTRLVYFHSCSVLFHSVLLLLAS